jgi:hypothetical protein
MVVLRGRRIWSCRVSFHVRSDTIAKSGELTEPAAGGLAGGGITLRLVQYNGQETNWKPAPDPKARAAPIERYLTFLTRRGPNLFTHDFTDISYSLEDVIELFAEHLPEAYRNSLFGEEPPEIAAVSRCYRLDE